MQNPPPVQTAKSSTGLDENVAALLAYLFNWVSGLIFFLIEKDSRLVRFHAMQSILWTAFAGVVFVVLWILWFVLGIATAMVSDSLGLLVSGVMGLLLFVFWLAVVGGFIFCMVKAYQRQFFKLPVIGNFAEKFSAK